MSDGAHGAGADPSPNTPGSDQPALSELRRLLFGPEQTKIQEVAQRLENPTIRTEDISHVLPQAVTTCVQRDARLANALAPAVESALATSVRRDPQMLASAIFPIMGPAIRKSIAEALRWLMDSFSRALDQSLSWQGLLWRLEAWRTGRPFAEVVLYHTLVYRVEQVFLVHRQTGLLLLHVSAPGVTSSDHDLTSGMLTAIRDFAKDSFGAQPSDELQSLQVGDLSIWVEDGPLAMLAAAIRGHAPTEVRHELQRALEAVHAEHGDGLARFAGEAAPFEVLQPSLAGCLLSRFTDTRRPQKGWRAPLVLGLVLVLGLAWLGSAWLESQRRSRLLDRLRREPGVVITEIESSRSRLVVSGLIDPLAEDPARFLGESGLRTNSVVFRWTPYLALDPDFTLRRARRRLAPPPGVELQLAQGVLTATGSASREWWTEARRLAPGIPGVERMEFAPSGPSDLESLERVVHELRQKIIYFEPAQAAPDGQNPAIPQVAELLRQLLRLARALDRTPVVRITGHTDRTGDEAFNSRLSTQRAESLRQRLVGLGLPASLFEVAGAKSTRAGGGSEPADSAADRRATFEVRWTP